MSPQVSTAGLQGRACWHSLAHVQLGGIWINALPTESPFPNLPRSPWGAGAERFPSAGLG